MKLSISCTQAGKCIGTVSSALEAVDIDALLAHVTSWEAGGLVGHSSVDIECLLLLLLLLLLGWGSGGEVGCCCYLCGGGWDRGGSSWLGSRGEEGVAGAAC